MSGPGGNNPLNFGKSKAKFQMEPNTGITFADVAGVEEAKADFMEVGHLCGFWEKLHWFWTINFARCCSITIFGGPSRTMCSAQWTACVCLAVSTLSTAVL